MAATQTRFTSKRLPLVGAKAKQPLDLLRAGMPSLDSIHDDSVTFKPTTKGRTYRILKTTEVDRYENTAAARGLRKAMLGVRKPSPAAINAAVKQKPSTGENYAGVDRKAAKLSISSAPVEKFKDVAALVASLPSVQSMVALKIPVAATSNRVKQESRNVQVTGFLYAASREADNDFHLIVGRDPKATPETYMTMEVSGLPPAGSASFGALNTARSAFEKFFGKNLPGAGYHFYQPPIRVQIQGSLFF